MKREWHLSLPTGFTLEETIESMSVVQAQSLLLTKRANRYVRARREGERADVYAHRITCPCCGRSFVYNGYTVRRVNRKAYIAPCRPRPPKARVREWADPQLSLFDEERAVLPLAPEAAPPEEFVCPACEQVSFPDRGAREVYLSHRKHKVVLRCEVVSLPEITCLHKFKEEKTHLQFPVYETLTFDLRRGRVHQRYEDKENTLLFCWDITERPDLLLFDACYWVLCRRPQVVRYIRHLFEQEWGVPLPYAAFQTDEYTLTQMTRFVGYPRSFYACIPYENGAWAVAEDFRQPAAPLHDARRLPQVYDAVGLPQAKSPRRCLFENPGLFFYAAEIRMMWEVLRDVNLLCRFLGGPRTFQVLSALHQRPLMREYLRDYAAVKSPHRLLAQMEELWETVASRAVDYASMSAAARRETQAVWRGQREAGTHRKLTYSVPMRTPTAEIPDCVVNGYTFIWLRSSNDYALAAHCLRNCLAEWQMQHPPVVSVRKNGRFVAAIEVAYPYVVQAMARNNSAIEGDPSLYDAVVRWMNRYGLRWGEDDCENEYEDDEEEP